MTTRAARLRHVVLLLAALAVLMGSINGIDNALSYADEVRPFGELRTRSGQATSQLLELGKGVVVCVKTGQPTGGGR